MRLGLQNGAKMEPKRHLKMKEMPPETHFEKDTVPKGPRDWFFTVFAAPEPLKMCLWPRRRAIFHIFTHFTFFIENVPKSHQKSSILGAKMCQKWQRKKSEKADSFLITFCLHFGSILGALGDPGPPFGIKNVSLGPLGRPLLAPVGPKTPPGTPKTSILVNFGGFGEHFPPFLEVIRLNFAPCVHAFMPLCLHAFMPLALTFLPPPGSAAVLRTSIIKNRAQHQCAKQH